MKSLKFLELGFKYQIFLECVVGDEIIDLLAHRLAIAELFMHAKHLGKDPLELLSSFYGRRQSWTKLLNESHPSCRQYHQKVFNDGDKLRALQEWRNAPRPRKRKRPAELIPYPRKA